MKSPSIYALRVVLHMKAFYVKGLYYRPGEARSPLGNSALNHRLSMGSAIHMVGLAMLFNFIYKPYFAPTGTKLLVLFGFKNVE